MKNSVINIEELRLLCKRLNLHHISKIDTFDLDIKDRMAYFKYLLEYELMEREKKVHKENRTNSHLPKVKEEITFKGIEEWNIEDIKKLKWLEDSSNIMIVGKCGKGKTTIATIIGNKAIDDGYKVYYLKVDEFLNVIKCPNGQKEKVASNRLKDADLIILDELMYLPMESEDIVQLYKAIMYYNQSRSFIFITNRRIEEWKDTTSDKHTMETFVDRIMIGTRQIILK